MGDRWGYFVQCIPIEEPKFITAFKLRMKIPLLSTLGWVGATALGFFNLEAFSENLHVMFHTPDSAEHCVARAESNWNS